MLRLRQRERMLAAAAALCLAASLILETAVPSQVPLGRVLAFAGLVFLVLAVLVPYRPRPPEVNVSEPHFGFTRRGLAVHHRAVDHLPVHSAYARLNKTVALAVTNWVGSMTCAWTFCLLALLSLPAVLTQALHVHWFPSWLVAVGLIALVAWIAQTFLQLVLLSVIMVGQNVQQAASDARAAKTFEDAEAANAALAVALDRLDTGTEGGLKAVLDAVNALAAREALEQKVTVQAAGPLSGAQVKQVTEAVQASLLEQAKRNRGTGTGLTLPGYGD